MRSSLVLLLLFVASIALAQEGVREPQILILLPDSTSTDASFRDSIEIETKRVRQSVQEALPTLDSLAKDSSRSKSSGVRISNAMVEAIRQVDFYSQASIEAIQMLQYSFYERFPNQMIQLAPIRAPGDIPSLHSIADQEHFQYVLNIRSIRIVSDSGRPIARMHVQLFDNSSVSLLFDNDYRGDWTNRGFEFSCVDSSLTCTINNALRGVIGDVIQVVSFNSPTLRRQKELEQERLRVLMNDYYAAPWDTSLVDRVVSPADSSIDRHALFQCLHDRQNSKFVAFYLRSGSEAEMRQIKQTSKDREVKIQVNKTLDDSDFLTDVPRMYAYVVHAVEYRGQWYYEKTQITYFDAKSVEEARRGFFNSVLQGSGFFKDNSTDADPLFWESELFDTIRDLRKDPKWPQYGARGGMWETQEMENRPYVGMPSVVASRLKRKAQQENDRLDSAVIDKYVSPFAFRLRASDSSEDYKVSRSAVRLIHPSDRSIYLFPLLVYGPTDTAFVRYFAIIPSEGRMYEWTYFTPICDSTTWWTGRVVDQMETITHWNYAFRVLDDRKFWENYVLKRSGGRYEFLKPVEYPGR